MFPIKDNIPTQRVPLVTLALILASVVVFFAFGISLSWRFVSGGLLQLGVNAVFLWWFGANVEDAMSRPRFLALFACGGAIAIGLLELIDASRIVPGIFMTGGIAAVIGGYLVLYPRAGVMTIVLLPFHSTLVELPAWALAGIWTGLQALFAATALATPLAHGGGIGAFVAQLGALVAGVLAIRLFAQRRKQLPAPVSARA